MRQNARDGGDGQAGRTGRMIGTRRTGQDRRDNEIDGAFCFIRVMDPTYIKVLVDAKRRDSGQVSAKSAHMGTDLEACWADLVNRVEINNQVSLTRLQVSPTMR